MDARDRSGAVRPVSLPFAVALFGVPGLVIYAATHFLVPELVDRGVALIHAWTAAVVIPTVLNAAFVLTYYHRTERPGFAEFVRRFRLERPPRRIFRIVPIAAVVIVIGNEALAWTVPILSDVGWLAPPDVVPEIFADVYETLGADGGTFMGEEIGAGSWWLVPYWLVFWVGCAVVGEEIVWRGYVLPAHEVRFGRFAWVINGALWNIPFHLYTAHNFFSDMPLYFLLPLLAYRMKNTWYAIGVHSLLVSLALVIYVAGVL